MNNNSSQQKIFGIGFPKTGTTSLEKALEVLELNVCKGNWKNHYSNFLLALYVNGDIDEIIKITNYFDAFADAPWGGTDLYKALYQAYPNAKFVLTIREPENWYRSFISVIEKLGSDLDQMRRGGRFGSAYFFPHIFKVESFTDNKENILAYYNNTNAAAERFLSEAGANYSVLNWEAGDGWPELCALLERPLPAQPFPHENKNPNKAISKISGSRQPSKAKAIWKILKS